MSFLRLLFWAAAAVSSLILLLLVIAAAVLLSLPDVHVLQGCLTTTMYKVHLCPTDGHYTPLHQISPDVIQAVVSSEDTTFYSHHGFDWYEIEQSLKANLAENHIHRGGSTLTQQLAKNIWLTKEKSYWRKGKEAYLTYELEKSFTKDFILEKYLNVVQFGHNLYGITDAAQFYFHKKPADLHLLEATFLAFLLPNPDLYSQSFSKGQLTPFGQKIIAIILKRMVQFKKITPGAYNFAMTELSSFPWRSLARSDFNKEYPGGPVPTTESSQDENALQNFLNDDSESSDDRAEDVPTPPRVAPKAAVAPEPEPTEESTPPPSSDEATPEPAPTPEAMPSPDPESTPAQ